jgi:hypothetical protein
MPSWLTGTLVIVLGLAAYIAVASAVGHALRRMSRHYPEPDEEDE